MDASAERPTRSVFSSADLPAHLDDGARFRLWRDIYVGRYGESDFTHEPDQPFFARSEFMPLGNVLLVRFDVTYQRWARTARQVAADARDDFLIGFNRGGHKGFRQRGREVEVSDASGGALFFTNGEPGEGFAGGRGAITGICVPRGRLLDLVGGAEDMVGSLLDPRNAATRHLGRYVDFLLDSDDIAVDRIGQGAIATVLLDLVALALGARGDMAELAGLRGLRATRLQAIVAEIKAGYAHPGFSVREVAFKLRLAPRTIQNLLSETGVSFTERVLELRLQKASNMLANPRHDHMRIAEIAYACGFNEVSYFNRCFRRRFGASPREIRGSGH